MKIIQVVLVAASTAFAQGCVSFVMGPERSFPDSFERNQIAVQSLTRIVPKITFVGHYSSVPTYKLELIAEGSFIKHTGHIMKRGTPCLSVGLWPGLADSNNKGELFFFSILGVYPFCGLPTLCSLLFEPFRDCREKPKHGVGDMADVGLIGVNKYYRNVGRDTRADFVTTSTERLSTYTLFGYGVNIDGVRFDDRDLGNGYQSVVYFTSSRPRGSRVTIRIVDTPASRSDGSDGFGGLKGMEAHATLP